MKKSFLVLSLLFAVVAVNAQTVEEIIKKNSVATGYDKLANAQTIFVEGRMSQMGTDMPLTIYVKRPDLVKSVITYNGMEIVTAYDGEKGYMINPMTGSYDPQEIPAEQLGEIKKNNMFNNPLQSLFEENKLQLIGDEDVDGKATYKVMATMGEEKPVYYNFDKTTFMLVKTTTTVSQMGQEMTVEAFYKEYVMIDGYNFPKVTTSLVNGTIEAGSVYFDKIEVNTPIEDSVFKIK